MTDTKPDPDKPPHFYIGFDRHGARLDADKFVLRDGTVHATLELTPDAAKRLEHMMMCERLVSAMEVAYEAAPGRAFTRGQFAYARRTVTR